MLLIPILAFFQLLSLSPSDGVDISFFNFNTSFIKVDPLSLTFGYVFVIASFAGFLYGIGIAKRSEYTSALIYIGSALSVVFAKDLMTLYIFWELMALSSVFLILPPPRHHLERLPCVIFLCTLLEDWYYWRELSCMRMPLGRHEL